MKKIALVGIVKVFAAFFPLTTWAGGGHGHYHQVHYRPHYVKRIVNYHPRPYCPPRTVVNVYRPAPLVRYAPPRTVVRYLPPRPLVRYNPRPYYYQPPQYYQDPRSTQGLAGGIIGGIAGYQLGYGNPLVTGVGAAAGSYLGNQVAR